MNLFRLGTWRVVLKRAGHDRVVVAAAFVTIVLATTLLASGPVYADAVALAGLERTLEDAPVRDVTVTVSSNLPADEYEEADARVSRSVEQAFGPDGATIHRSARSGTYSLPELPDLPDDALTIFGSYDDLPGHATLVDGAWPAGAVGTEVEAALSQGAAQSLGLQVGDTLEVTSTLDEDERLAVRIASVYRVGDVDDPFW